MTEVVISLKKFYMEEKKIWLHTLNTETFNNVAFGILPAEM